MFDKVHRALAKFPQAPVEVWVDTDMIYRPWLAPGRGPIGPLIEDKGLAVPLAVEGVLHAWVRHCRGGWLALVSYEFRTDSGLGPIRMRHLLPEKAAKRRLSKFEEEPF